MSCTTNTPCTNKGFLWQRIHEIKETDRKVIFDVSSEGWLYVEWLEHPGHAVTRIRDDFEGNSGVVCTPLYRYFALGIY